MTKVLLFEDPNEFLKVMEDIQREYNKQQQTKADKGEFTNE